MVTSTPEEFVVQIGIGDNFIFSPFSQRIYANCDDSKQTLDLKGYKTIKIPEGCTVTTQNHVIQTSTKKVVNYDVEIETMELKLENLIDNSSLNTQQLIQILSEAGSENEKLTINDIKKRCQLKTIHRHNVKTSIWIYSIAGALIILIAIFGYCQLKIPRSTKSKCDRHIELSHRSNQQNVSTTTMDSLLTGNTMSPAKIDATC